MIGTTLAHYELESSLGEGGSGVVYRARDLRLDRQVAVKVLAEVLRRDELAWGRLLREARLASRLNHPHIAAVYDLGEEDDRAFIAMEYVEGLPLADLIPEGGMSAEQLRQYAAQIADALAYAHQQGVVHGDLKGSNIMVTPEGQTKLLDFGLSRRVPRQGVNEVTSTSLALAQAGAAAGTLPYLAPEVLRGGSATTQSDIWSFGVLLYQMATGELPFRGETPFELSMEIMVGTPSLLERLPQPIQTFLGRCMEKNPAARPLRVDEVASALEGNSPAPEPAPAPEPTPPPTVGAVHSAWARWAKWWTGTAALLLLAVGGRYSGHVWSVPSADRAPSTAASLPAPSGKADVQVWVNTASETYHCPGSRWYGKTQQGEYMKQTEALAKGYHPAGHRACR